MSILNYYQSGQLVLPSALLFNYHKIFDQTDDFLVWQFCYLQNTTNLVEILPSQMAESLGTTVTDITQSLGRLTEKNLLTLKTIEVDGEVETIFDTSPALEKLESLLQPQSMPEAAPTSLQDGNALKALVADFERELGRLLSPFELEDLQKTLKEDNIEPDVVREALKEAVFNGKRNWKYIQAILRNWRQDGIVTLRQIEERRREREGLDQKNLVLDDDFKQMLSANLFGE